jgi:hypothetical protein
MGFDLYNKQQAKRTPEGRLKKSWRSFEASRSRFINERRSKNGRKKLRMWNV